MTDKEMFHVIAKGYADKEKGIGPVAFASAIMWADKELTRLKEAVDDIPALIRGHKSHWQEPLDKFERDQLLEGVAKHVEYRLKEGK